MGGAMQPIMTIESSARVDGVSFEEESVTIHTPQELMTIVI